MKRVALPIKASTALRLRENCVNGIVNCYQCLLIRSSWRIRHQWIRLHRHTTKIEANTLRWRTWGRRNKLPHLKGTYTLCSNVQRRSCKSIRHLKIVSSHIHYEVGDTFYYGIREDIPR